MILSAIGMQEYNVKKKKKKHEMCLGRRIAHGLVIEHEVCMELCCALYFRLN